MRGGASALARRRAAFTRPVPTPVRRRPWTSAGWLTAVAASAALLIGALWSVRQLQHLQGQLTAKDQEVAAIEQTKSELEEQLESSGREVEELRGELQTMTDASEELAERNRQVAKLRREIAASPLHGVLANLPVAFLRGGRTRGEHPVPIPEGTPRVALVVEVIDPEPYERYRLQIVERRTDGALVWESDQLRRHGSVLSLSLPTSLFDAGSYDLFLRGIDEQGREIKLEESYLMKVWWTEP